MDATRFRPSMLKLSYPCLPEFRGSGQRLFVESVDVDVGRVFHQLEVIALENRRFVVGNLKKQSDQIVRPFFKIWSLCVLFNLTAESSWTAILTAESGGSCSGSSEAASRWTRWCSSWRWSTVALGLLLLLLVIAAAVVVVIRILVPRRVLRPTNMNNSNFLIG